MVVPVETKMNLSDTKQQLSRVVNSVARGESRVVIEKSGLEVVAIISADEYRRFRRHEDERAAVRARIAESLGRVSAAFADITDDELDEALSKAKSEARSRPTRDG